MSKRKDPRGAWNSSSLVEKDPRGEAGAAGTGGGRTMSGKGMKSGIHRLRLHHAVGSMGSVQY